MVDRIVNLLSVAGWNLFADAWCKRQIAEHLVKHDVIEVVRCKDCCWANDNCTYCRYGVGRNIEPMGYCQDGRRCEEDG